MYFRTQTQSRTGCVHSHITTADNSNFLALHDRCGGIRIKCLHQVASGQVLVCREYAVCVLARDAHKLRQTCTGTDEYCIKSFFFEQLVNGDGLADDHIGVDLYTQRLHILDLFFHYRFLRETEFRNTVYQYTAGFVQCLKDRYIIAHLCQVACAGQSCRAGSDDRDFLAVLFLCRFGLDAVLSCPVSNETLQLTDGYGFAFDTAYALAFALALLRAHTAADCRQCGRLTDDLVCFRDLSFFYFLNECRNVDGYRASLHAACIFAVQASGCLGHCLFLIISLADLGKILCAYCRLLLPYGYFLHYIYFNSHDRLPPLLNR